MKTMKLKYLVVAIASGCLMVQSAFALSITDAGVVGTIEAGTESANVANELAWSNYLLSLGSSATASHDANGDGNNESYATGPTDYSGTLSGGTQVDSGSTDVSGYEYVLAKYDGQNAGYVLFNVADLLGNNIPSSSADIWVNGAQQGYQLSHFTGFGSSNGVPDAGSTLGLLGLAVLGVGLLRRKVR